MSGKGQFQHLDMKRDGIVWCDSIPSLLNANVLVSVDRPVILADPPSRHLRVQSNRTVQALRSAIGPHPIAV